MNYENIKSNFDKGAWNERMVKEAVKRGVISRAEYQQITSKVYVA